MGVEFKVLIDDIERGECKNEVFVTYTMNNDEKRLKVSLKKFG